MKKIDLQKGKKSIWENEDKSRKSKAAELGDLGHNIQIGIINTYYSGGEVENQKILVQELEKKRCGYHQQDIKKERISKKETIITLDEIVEKLVASKLKCYYCKSIVKIFYQEVRDPEQWTLDRVDNDLPHSSDNTIVCCLKCNLERRRIDSKKFDFTKNLTINKLDN